MSIKLDSRVSLSLHPATVTKIDGYSEATAVYVAPVRRLLEEAYTSIAAVFDAKDASLRDPTLNDAGRIVKTDDKAQKVLGKLTRAFDAERGNLERGIAHIEKELQAPVTAKAAHSIASEIRAHVNGLPSVERFGFIRAAIERGDVETATACLGAPGYLSGIDDNTKGVLLRIYHEHNAPGEAAKLKVMEGAKKLIEERGGLLFIELEKAVGERPDVVRKMREAKARSDKAFAA